jgi:3,4-dihydroxy-2-butanone 4-phosphate synthase
MAKKSQQLDKALSAFKKGEFVIVVDDEHRENEGDLIIAAQDITPKKINFVLSHARGMMCVPMTKRRLSELKLPLMVERNEENTKCMFTISTDARKGISTGISAADRARTISLLASKKSTPSDFVRPGHIFPLKAADGLLRERQGHTEAALELCKRTGKEPVAILCEILNDDGTMARMPDLLTFAKKHGLCLITIHDLRASL